ncbi:hypothetical protein [Dickeya chrysanthemi]|uniref:hypothetical protein n=1 Tax=Dickeya chrysanthemi TaxID=556 RepID=UPI000484E37A|nr:hypothetical protein [Dickeya chrysanthemi]
MKSNQLVLITFSLFSASGSVLAKESSDVFLLTEKIKCTEESVSDYFYFKVNDDVFKINLSKSRQHNYSGDITYTEDVDYNIKKGIFEVRKKINFFSLPYRVRYGCKNAPLNISGSDFSDINAGYLTYSYENKKIDINLHVVYAKHSYKPLAKDIDNLCKAIKSSILINRNDFFGCFRGNKQGSIDAGYFYIPQKHYSPNGISVLEGYCQPNIREGANCYIRYKEGERIMIKYSFIYSEGLWSQLIKMDGDVRRNIIIETDKGYLE